MRPDRYDEYLAVWASARSASGTGAGGCELGAIAFEALQHDARLPLL